MAKNKFTYGPVPSRRLGRSLGVDIVPFKTCSFDCVYCQLGRTTDLTCERREYVPVKEVLRDIRRSVEKRKPDYVTFSGSGEPTLHAGLGEMIDHIRLITDTPVAVLTNASLLYDEDVIRDVAKADLVVPSLDAPNAALFEQINRPAKGATFDRLVSGLSNLRHRFDGKIHLEVMMIDGLTSDDGVAAELGMIVKAVRADLVEINTPVRPPAEEHARPIEPRRLRELAHMIGVPNVKVIGAPPRAEDPTDTRTTEEVILDLIARRPCTTSDIAAGLEVSEEETERLLRKLESRKIIEEVRMGDSIYYRPCDNSE